MGTHVYERTEERYCICGAVIFQRNARSRETGRLVRRGMVKPSLLRRFEAKHSGEGHRLIDAKTYHEKYPLCPFPVSLVDLAVPFRPEGRERHMLPPRRTRQ